MKLNRLQIKHFVGIGNADIDFETPVTLFVGSNNQGKSSVRDAIEFGLTGKCRAGDKWKDAKELVRGKGRMGVKLAYQEDDKPGTAMRSPSTASNDADERPILRYCLRPIEFIKLLPKERAKILSEVCGGGAEKLAKAAIQKHVGEIKKDILKELKDRSVNFLDVDSFRTAVVELRKEFKRVVKDESRSPLMQDFQLEPEFNLEQAEAKIEELASRIKKGGDLVAEAKEKLKVQAEIVDLQGSIKKLVRPKKVPKKPETPGGDVEMADVYLTLIEGLLKCTTTKSICCPLCDGKRLREQFTLKEKTLTEFLTKNQGAAKEYEAAVKATAGYEESLKTVTARLEELQKQDNKVTLTAGSENLLGDLTTERDGLQSQIGSYALYQQALKAFEKKQEAAKEYGGIIEECDRIDKCLKDGGPVKAAIAAAGQQLPINTKLLELWGMEALQLTDTGDITLRGIRIETCSPSEQYRASCVLGMALAELSGIGVVALDEFSILDIHNQNKLMKVVRNCGLETLLIFSTDIRDYSKEKIPAWVRVFTVEKGNILQVS